MKNAMTMVISACSMSPMKVSSTKETPASMASLCLPSSNILMKKSRKRGMNPMFMYWRWPKACITWMGLNAKMNPARKDAALFLVRWKARRYAEEARQHEAHEEHGIEGECHAEPTGRGR